MSADAQQQHAQPPPQHSPTVPVTIRRGGPPSTASSWRGRAVSPSTAGSGMTVMGAALLDDSGFGWPATPPSSRSPNAPGQQPGSPTLPRRPVPSLPVPTDVLSQAIGALGSSSGTSTRARRSSIASSASGSEWSSMAVTPDIPDSRSRSPNGYYNWNSAQQQQRYLGVPDIYGVSRHTAISWEEAVVLPRTWQEASRRLKVMIRRGVPDAMRNRVWMLVTGARELLDTRPTCYEVQSEETFGRAGAPSSLANYPEFGGKLVPEGTGRVAVSYWSLESAKRILCVLATMHPGLSYCPALPDIALILLGYMNERETFATMLRVLQRSLENGSAFYVETTLVGMTKLCKTFDALVLQVVPVIYARLCQLKAKPEALALKWFSSFFAGFFPHNLVVRIMDCFLNEGSRILIRIGLGLLSQAARAIIDSRVTAATVNDVILAVMAKQDLRSLFKATFRMIISEQDVQVAKSLLQPVSVEEPVERVYYRPKVESPSEVFTHDELEELWSFLPERFATMDPKLLFRSSRDGFNLKRLLQKVGEAAPTIIVVRIRGGAVFGTFASEPWTTVGDSFYGSGECFVFTLHPVCRCWPAKEFETALQHVSRPRDLLSMGVNAFCLNEEMFVTTSPSSVFDNPSLAPVAHTEQAECVEVEAWTVD